MRHAGWSSQRAEPDASPDGSVIDRQALHDEMNTAWASFRQLLEVATSADLHRRSAGTRWTNQQLLFHMVLGYLVVFRLLPLVHLFGRLPDGAGRRFAAILNATTRPFHVINYLGSVGGGAVLPPIDWTHCSNGLSLA